MFRRESVERCSECDAITPHSRRFVAVPKLLALVFLTGAVGGFLLEARAWPLSGILLAAAACLHLHDRRALWTIACERCRGKARAQLPPLWPNLDHTVFGG